MSAPAQPIESICGAIIGADEPPSWFKVGTEWKQHVGYEQLPGVPKKLVFKDHVVTRIEYRDENRGDHGIGWFDVWAGDVCIASLNERHVHEVYYQIPTGDGAG